MTKAGGIWNGMIEGILTSTSADSLRRSRAEYEMAGGEFEVTNHPSRSARPRLQRPRWKSELTRLHPVHLWESSECCRCDGDRA